MRTLLTALALVATLTACDDPAPPRASLTSDAPAASDSPGLLAQLTARADVRRATVGATRPQALFQCADRVLGRDGRRIYLWLSCGDYRTGPHPALIGGSSLPAVVTVDRHGSVAEVAFARQQSLEADIRRLFPPRLQDRVIAGDIATRPSPAVLLARAQNTAPRPPGP